MAEPSTLWVLATCPLWLEDGYARRTLDVIHELRRRGVGVGVLTVVPLRRWRDPARLATSRRLAGEWGVPVVELAGWPDLGLDLARRAADRGMPPRLARMAERLGASAIHARGLRAGSFCSAVPSRTPVVVDVDGDLESEAATELAVETTRRARARLSWAVRDTDRALARADGMIAVSPEMVPWLMAKSARADVPIVMVPCCVDATSFVSTPRVLAPDSRLTICYLGGLQAYQSPEVIADACAGLATVARNLDFWVVTTETRSDVEAAFATRGMRARVEGLSAQQVRERLWRADVGIVPRRPDPTNRVACPTKMGEYLAAGVPVLVSDAVGSWARTLQLAGVGSSLDAPADELGAFLQQVRSRREELAQRCRAAAEDLFSWSAACDLLLELYRGLGVAL